MALSVRYLLGGLLPLPPPEGLPVVEEIEVGQFKSTDCQRIVKERWPRHPLASAGGASFGAEFKNNIWPVLEGWGVEISNPGKNPIKY